MARTRSQAELMANNHDQLIKENARLAIALEHSREETNDIRDCLNKTLASLDEYKAEARLKEDIISKKNLMIQRLKQKNQQRKVEIELEINNLKKFWERYYDTD